MHVPVARYLRVDWFPADVGASPLSFCPCWLSQQVWQCLTSVRKKEQQTKCGNQMDNWCYRSLIGHYRLYYIYIIGLNFNEIPRLNIRFHTHNAVWAEKHMSLISFNVFVKQAIYWTKYSRNVTNASRASLAQCVGEAASKFPPNGCLAGPQRTRRTQVKCFSSGWC